MSLSQDFAPVHDAAVRLAILRLLAGQAEGHANDAVLCDAVNAMDMVNSRQKIREHIFWLHAQGLISVLDLRTSNGLVVATLAERGADVAAGRSHVPGVARPSREG